MKKFFLSGLLVLLASFVVDAQKVVNDEMAEKRSVPSFHGIHVSTGIRLYLSQGTEEAVAVSASSADFRDRIITEVKNGILRVYYENKLGMVERRREKKELKAYVSAKTIDELNANTGALVEVDGSLQSPSLKLIVNTGAIVKAAVKVTELKVDQNTGSIVTLSGQADKMDVDGDTGSIFKGAELQTVNCSVTASTGAGVYVQVDKELNAKADTGGFVRYKGTAGIREIKTSTGGSISKI